MNFNVFERKQIAICIISNVWNIITTEKHSKILFTVNKKKGKF